MRPKWGFCPASEIDKMNDFQAETHSELDTSPVSPEAWAITRSVTIASVIMAFLLMAILGTIVSWLKYDEPITEVLIRGLKFGFAASVGIALLPLVGKGLTSVRVPQWFVTGGAFAVAFAVLHGLNAVLEQEYVSALGRTGSGFFSGFLAGCGIYWAQRKGWVKPPHRVHRKPRIES